MDQDSTDQPATAMEPAGALDRPQLIFFSELDGGALAAMLARPGLLDTFVAQGYSIALALPRLDEPHAQAARMLNQRAIPIVAWLLLPPEEGFAFNLQNYPQAVTRYHAFHEWAQAHDLRFTAVGLDIEPPISEMVQEDRWSLRDIVRRLWLAHDNVLYPSARAAYIELIAAIHHDGYEVHTYQMPVIADDRRAGTTLIQRVLDIVDLPSDVDVLMCSSSVPIERLRGDLGGALIASYGPVADAIGVGSTAGGEEAGSPTRLAWPALRRDLLLAAQHTDTLYLTSLEDCTERGLLPQIAALDWDAPTRPARGRRLAIGLLRTLLLALLVAGRFGGTILAWAGWALAIALWIRGRQRRKRLEIGD